MNYTTATMSQLDNEYNVEIEGEHYDIWDYGETVAYLEAENEGAIYDGYDISGVVVHEGEYFMTISDPSPGKEDQTKTLKLVGDLQGFQQKINNYVLSQDTESKGNLRF